MTEAGFVKYLGNTPTRFSYFFITGTLILAAVFHLGTPLLVALFAYFTLSKLHFVKNSRKGFTIALFLVCLSAITYGLVIFIKDTVRALPEIADKAIPSVIQVASRYKVELPFSDYDTLKETAVESVKSQAEYLRSAVRIASGAGKQLMFVIIGIVVAIGLFLRPRIDPDAAQSTRTNLYSLSCEQVALRFQTLFRSFETVMGAQLVISGINTVLTTIFVVATHLPYAFVVVGVTFLCGLIPVIGNLISNTIIVGIGFTISPGMALAALVFLVLIHKLEYFLNSKIIGDRIRYPLWLTLLGLVLGERLMGVPGMILAPVVLSYIRMEASQIRIDHGPAEKPPDEKKEHLLQESAPSGTRACRES